MFSSSRRPVARVGGAAIVTALVGLAGYGVGLTQSPGGVVSAEIPSVRAVDDSARQSTSPKAPQAGPTSYSPIVDAVSPAVVTIRVDKRASVMPTQFPDDELFRFFGREFQLPRQPRVPRQSGLGSGVITSADGYILTNNHVIDDADAVRVELPDMRTFDAKVVGTDPASDLAVLKIDASNLPTVKIGDSSRVRVGDVVLAVGNPLGVGQTVTMGIISAKGRATGLGDGSYEDFLQTDAPINQGNSGGPLVNLTGELVGINSQILTPTGGNIGLGFAIPSNMAREVMDQLKSTGEVRRGRLGVGIQSITPDIAANLALPDTSGALVSSVEAGSPASNAGFKQRDVITTVNGERVTDSNMLRNRIAGTKPGSTMTFGVIRDGRPHTVQATLGELQASRSRAQGEDERSEGPTFGPVGMEVEALTPGVARELRLPDRTEGVVVRRVNPNGAAASAGLRPGDVISQVNGREVTSPAELKSVLNETGERPALMLVTRDNADIFLTLRKPRG
jgi:Do/DeqQ family serine protease